MNRRLPRASTISLAISAALAALTSPTGAQTWTNPGNGNWDTGSNWSGNAAPGNNAVVTINVAGPATVTYRPISGTTSIGSLTLTSPNILAITGGQLNVQNNSSSGGAITVSAGGFGINGGTFANAGGTVSTSATGALSIGAAVLLGGTLSLGGSVDVAMGNGATIYDTIINSTGAKIVQGSGINGRVGDVTIGAGAIVQAGNNATLFIAKPGAASTITNQGELRTNASAGFSSQLRLDGDVTVLGSGTVTLQDVNARIIDDFGNRALTIGANQVLQGQGAIGQGTSLRLVNTGLVSANVNALALTLNGGTVTNTGTLQATGGGVLSVGNLLINNAGGTVQALAGSAVVLGSGATIYDGQLATGGDGLIRQSDGVNSRIGGALTITAGSTVQAGNNAGLFLGQPGTGNTLTNNGTIQTNASAGFASSLRLDGDVTLAGTGSVTLQNTNARVMDDFGNRRLTLGSGQTVQGFGNLGVGTSLAITNNGLITANQAATALTVQMANGIINAGTMRAESGGTLEFTGSSFVRNDGGTLASLAGSTVGLGASTIYNGLLSGSGTFLERNGINARLSGTEFGTLGTTNVPRALTIASGTTVSAGNNSSLYFDGSIVNNGQIATTASAGFQSNLVVNTTGGVTFSGSGVITLQDPNARITDDFGNRTMTHGAGHTIQGRGQIGGGTSLQLTNQGLITANVNGQTLNISTSNAVTNTGTLRAEGGATLALNTSSVANTGGLIEALDLSNVALANNFTIVGGRLATSGNGVIRGADGNNVRLSGVTLDSGANYRVGNNATTFLNGTINSGGSITTTANAGFQSNVSVNTADGATLAGSGRITLQNGSARIVDDFGQRTLIQQSGHTIEGFGQLGGGTSLIFDNRGLVTANAAASTLTVQTSNTVLNTGTMRAENGGVLAFNATTVNNAGGLINAQAASTVSLAGSATLIGGLLSTTGDGVVRGVDSQNVRLSGVTLQGTNGYRVGNNATTFIDGLITNDSLIQTTASAGFQSNLGINGVGDATLSGTGSVVLQNANARIADDFSNRMLTNDSGHTIAGFGQLGGGTTLRTTNAGTVNANVAAQTLLVNGGNVTSSGTLRASNGGILRFTSGSHTVQAGGLVEALANSTVQIASTSGFTNLAAGTLTGGIWKGNSSGGAAGVIDFQANNTTISTNSADIYLIGAAGQIQGRDAGGVLRTLDQTLSSNLGALRIQNGRSFVATAAGGAFVNGNGALLELTDGSFQSASLNLSNNASSISSFGTSAITTTAPVGGSGQIHVHNGSLAMSRGFDLGAGSLASIAGGATLNLSTATAASRVATLSDSGALSLGTQNLLVTKDYDNANFGNGNAFNARAGVTGTGQIIGVNANQTITGNVSAAGANTWTLALGNVRGGTAQTVNFQIANNGSGADIRGALQNPALTDVRLSGAGTVAGNFGPVIAGASTSNYPVTFTASAGGSLSGQSLTVVSNFSNVPTQTINLSGLATALAVGSATPSANPVDLGNFRVGGAMPSQSFNISNTTVGAGAERLAVLSVGSSGNFSAVNNLGGGFVNPGANAANAVAASVNAGVAGVNNGSLTIHYGSNGQLIDPGFTTQAANSQQINLQSSGYVPASGNLLTPSNLFVLQVGQSSAPFALQIQNNASGPGGFVEDLNARFGSVGSNPTISVATAGQVNNLAAGQTSNGAMTVTVTGQQAGTVNNFPVPVNYFSAGSVGGQAIAGLSELGVGSSTFFVNANISLNVINTAQPVVNGVAGPGAVAVNFGNLRINSSVAQNLSIYNQAVGGDQALLDTSIGGVSGAATHNSGSFTGLAPSNGANPNTALAVGLDASVAGARNGTVILKHVSDATALGGSTFALPDQPVNVSANVYRLANGQLSTPVINIAARVGDAVAADRAVGITNSSPDIFTEGLKVTLGSTSGNAQHNGGSITSLAAQASDNTSIKVGLANTATAGIGNASVQLNYTSTGAGTTGAPDIAAGSASVAVNSKIYTPAIGQGSNTTLDFGVVRVGQAVATQNVSIKNDAAVTALNDTLRAELGPLGSPVTQSGPISALAAQATSAFSIGLNTAQAGHVNTSALVSYLSQNPDMADISGGASSAVQVLATINNLANADFDLLMGAGVLSQNGTQYVLDLGTIVLGNGFSVVLGLDNEVVGPADLLSGAFDLGQADDFGYAGWGPVANLAAGQGVGGLTINFTQLGQYEDAITFNGLGTNASDPQGLAQSRTLVIRANLIDQPGGNPVSTPGSLMLMLGAAAAALVTRRRQRAR